MMDEVLEPAVCTANTLRVAAAAERASRSATDPERARKWKADAAQLRAGVAEVWHERSEAKPESGNRKPEPVLV